MVTLLDLIRARTQGSKNTRTRATASDSRSVDGAFHREPRIQSRPSSRREGHRGTCAEDSLIGLSGKEEPLCAEGPEGRNGY
jgi:hypothetical protein